MKFFSWFPSVFLKINITLQNDNFTAHIVDKQQENVSNFSSIFIKNKVKHMNISSNILQLRRKKKQRKKIAANFTSFKSFSV